MQKNKVDPTVSGLVTATPSDKTVQAKKRLTDNAMQPQDGKEGTDSATTSSNAWWIALIAFCVLTATVLVLWVKKKRYFVWIPI